MSHQCSMGNGELVTPSRPWFVPPFAVGREFEKAAYNARFHPLYDQVSTLVKDYDYQGSKHNIPWIRILISMKKRMGKRASSLRISMEFVLSADVSNHSSNT